MATYTGRYKIKGAWFWKKLRRVKGDWLQDGIKGIVFEDESQLHFPVDAVIILWDRSRFEHIRNKAESEIGQKIPLKE